MSLDFSDLQGARGYNGWRAYGRSKLANILFTREAARRLAGDGVTANCFHPGFVASRFGSASGGWTSRLMPLARTFGDHAEAGRRHADLSRLVARCREGQRRLFRQARGCAALRRRTIGSLNDNFGVLGSIIVGIFVVAWLVSYVVYRAKGYDGIEVSAG